MNEELLEATIPQQESRAEELTPRRRVGQRRSFEAQFVRARQIIANAIDSPELHPHLARYGYDEARLQEGWELYRTARELHEAQRAAYGAKLEATKSFQRLYQQAKQHYRMHFLRAQSVFMEDREAAKALQLSGRRKGTFAGFVDQAKHFYNNALVSPRLSEALTSVGVSADELTKGRNRLTRVLKARETRENLQADAQLASKARNAALQELNRWLRHFIRSAHMALEHEPETLVRFGFAATRRSC